MWGHVSLLWVWLAPLSFPENSSWPAASQGRALSRPMSFIVVVLRGGAFGFRYDWMITSRDTRSLKKYIAAKFPDVELPASPKAKKAD